MQWGAYIYVACLSRREVRRERQSVWWGAVDADGDKYLVRRPFRNKLSWSRKDWNLRITFDVLQCCGVSCDKNFTHPYSNLPIATYTANDSSQAQRPAGGLAQPCGGNYFNTLAVKMADMMQNVAGSIHQPAKLSSEYLPFAAPIPLNFLFRSHCTSG